MKDTKEISFEPIIIVKYGELSLKGKNRGDFVSILHKNIKHALKNVRCFVQSRYDYLELHGFEINEIKNIVQLLQIIPGISVIFFGYRLSRDMQLLQNCVTTNLDDNTTFKIECRRKDKNYGMKSMDIIKTVSGFALNENQTLKVDLHKPDTKIYIEVLKESFLVFVKRYNGLGGLPVGSGGRALVLLSGGIDSPVAAHMMMKRGMQVDFLTFITPPHTSEQALSKSKQLSKVITANSLLCNSKLYVANFSSIIRELNHISQPSYKITILRRCFLKFAKELCRLYNYEAIITGEALGQVASQTIASLKTISASAPDLLVLRPLIGFDKNEIIAYAKKIKTYDISILPFADACSLFVPKNPVTFPKESIAAKIEQEVEYIDILIKKLASDQLKILKVGDIPNERIQSPRSDIKSC